ncbi:hypothetical protein BJY00DRAFT_317501 [Aspergillus carlsbadensis]|nr:hypothetical protein BJY00DRAFT_317501 [Aspergillus carlsbadensis]
MTKPTVLFHVLSGTVDLEARKSAQYLKAEDEKVANHPKWEKLSRFRSTQKKSLDLLEEVARYLMGNGLNLFRIYCGYDVEKQAWKVFYIFGRAAGLTEAMRKEATAEIIARFLDSKAEMDMPLQKLGDIPARVLYHWDISQELKHLTRLIGCAGQVYTCARDGEMDNSELRAGVKRWGEDVPVALYLKPVYKLLLARAGQDRPDLTLEQSFKRMRMPSADEEEERWLLMPPLEVIRQALFLCSEVSTGERWD